MKEQDRNFKYDELKKTALEVKYRLIKDGRLKAGDRIRKKPRDSEKGKLLFLSAMTRLKNYQPYYNEKGLLVMPYFRILSGKFDELKEIF